MPDIYQLRFDAVSKFQKKLKEISHAWDSSATHAALQLARDPTKVALQHQAQLSTARMDTAASTIRAVEEELHKLLSFGYREGGYE